MSYYASSANDVWSLGVILVNLTCGRNPWKQASFDDSTYRAFTRSPSGSHVKMPGAARRMYPARTSSR